jgi:hypothetical protein
VDPENRLGRQRCTEVQELNRVDITVRPQAAPDSRALYLAD